MFSWPHSTLDPTAAQIMRMAEAKDLAIKASGGLGRLPRLFIVLLPSPIVWLNAQFLRTRSSKTQGGSLVERIQTEVLQRLGGFSVSQISDALGFSHPVEAGLWPVDPVFKIVGRAATVLCEPDDNLAVLHALNEAQKGDVLIISCSAQGGTAVWGEVMSLAAQLRGLAGTIVDGAVRDALEIKKMAYPVFSRSLNARRGRKEKSGEHNVPVRCGSIVIRPGDIVFADANGILTIPGSSIQEVLVKVEEVSRKESDVKEELSRGRNILNVLKLENRYKHPTESLAQQIL